MKLPDKFYLYREDGSEVINVTYCRDCGDRYYVLGLHKTIYEHLNEKWQANKIMQYKSVHNLFFEHELNSQMNIFDVYKKQGGALDERD